MRKLAFILFFILISWLALIGSVTVTIKVYDYIHPIKERIFNKEETEFYHSYHGIGMRVDGTCLSSWEDPSGWWFMRNGKKCIIKTEGAVKAWENYNENR